MIACLFQGLSISMYLPHPRYLYTLPPPSRVSLHTPSPIQGTAKILIEAGADISAFNEFGDNPLLTAIKHNNENVLAVILGCDRWKDAIRVKPVESLRKSMFSLHPSNSRPYHDLP